jgi:hypothetical protein
LKDRDFPQRENPFLSSQRSPLDSLEEPCPRCSGWLSPGFTSIPPGSFPELFIKIADAVFKKINNLFYDYIENEGVY